MFFYDAPEGQGEQYQVDIVTDGVGWNFVYDVEGIMTPIMTPIMMAYSFQGFMFC